MPMASEGRWHLQEEADSEDEGAFREQNRKALEQYDLQSRKARKRKRSKGVASESRQIARPVFSYNCDESDHAETPHEAYADVAPMLRIVANCIGSMKCKVQKFKK